MFKQHRSISLAWMLDVYQSYLNIGTCISITLVLHNANMIKGYKSLHHIVFECENRMII